ncbi:MAG TPA: hypothetical protein VFD66_01690, partial [Verrucomicrobiae bacterium]|nr:hypothetical protein [Verrucomicrobiae bacterium]
MTFTSLSRHVAWAAWFSILSLVHGSLAATAIPATDTNTPTSVALQKAGKLFEEQNWAEARAAYDNARSFETNWSAPPVRLTVEGAVACSLKLQLWDDALSRAEEFVQRTKGTLEEAVGERFLGGLYLTIPHHGTKRGATFLRGQWTQGVQVYSWRKDSREAIRHYERARDLLRALPAKSDDLKKLVNDERIGLDFDLATALSSSGQYGSQYGGGRGPFWWWWDSGLEAEEDSEAVEEADYEEPRWAWGWGGQDQQTPVGIPLGPDGKPQFVGTPTNYSAQLGNGPKIRFL